MATATFVVRGLTCTNASGLLTGRTPGIELDSAGPGKAAVIYRMGAASSPSTAGGPSPSSSWSASLAPRAPVEEHPPECDYVGDASGTLPKASWPIAR